MTKNEIEAGLAALTICESLLIALTDKAVLLPSEVRGLLADAAAAHREAATTSDNPETNIAVAAMIEAIRKSRNSIRLVT